MPFAIGRRASECWEYSICGLFLFFRKMFLLLHLTSLRACRFEKKIPCFEVLQILFLEVRVKVPHNAKWLWTKSLSSFLEVFLMKLYLMKRYLIQAVSCRTWKETAWDFLALGCFWYSFLLGNKDERQRTGDGVEAMSHLPIKLWAVGQFLCVSKPWLAGSFCTSWSFAAETVTQPFPSTHP